MADLKIDTDGHIYFDQDADANLDYTFKWPEYLSGGAISSSVWEAEGGSVTLGDGSNGAPAPSYLNKSDYSARIDSTYYAKGAGIVPAVSNGFSYENIRAGVSGSTAVSFPTIDGETVSDGDCVWRCWRDYTQTTVWVIGSSTSTGLVTNHVDSGNSKQDRSFRIKITPAKGS